MIILNRLVIGGTAINSLEMIRALKLEYHIILVTGAKHQDEFEFELKGESLAGFEWVRLPGLQRPINPFNDIRAFFELRSLIAKKRPAIVHTIGAKPGFLGRLAARINHVPVIIHAYHGHVFSAYFNPFVSTLLVMIERLSARWTTLIISVSKKQVDELADKYRIAPKEKIIHLPIGINLENFQDESGGKRASFREKYLLQEDEVAIGIVGRIVPIKDHYFFLDVVEKTAGQKLNIRYFIIGNGVKLRRKLEELATSKGLEHTYFPEAPRRAFLTFTSWIEKMDIAMAGLDIITLTSKNEGTPLSVIEAGLMGKPVVATDVGAVDEVMIAGVTGFISKQGDLENFAKQVIMLVENPSLRAAMGAKGKTLTSERYSLDAQVKATRKLYDYLITKS